MQLFCVDFEEKGKNIWIQNKEVVQQMRKVLRAKEGDVFFVQKEIGNKTIRIQAALKNRTDKELEAEILNMEEKEIGSNTKTMLVAMPNKRQKAELIVQKLTEIGIENIVFWPAERSVIKDANSNKIQRLEKIMQEALEQSRGRRLPVLKFEKNIEKLLDNEKTIVFDRKEGKTVCDENFSGTIGIVGPEGGFTDADYDKFGKNICVKKMGETILRTETAAIVGGWVLVNSKSKM